MVKPYIIDCLLLRSLYVILLCLKILFLVNLIIHCEGYRLFLFYIGSLTIWCLSLLNSYTKQLGLWVTLLKSPNVLSCLLWTKVDQTTCLKTEYSIHLCNLNYLHKNPSLPIDQLFQTTLLILEVKISHVSSHKYLHGLMQALYKLRYCF